MNVKDSFKGLSKLSSIEAVTAAGTTANNWHEDNDVIQSTKEINDERVATAWVASAVDTIRGLRGVIWYNGGLRFEGRSKTDLVSFHVKDCVVILHEYGAQNVGIISVCLNS